MRQVVRWLLQPRPPAPPRGAMAAPEDSRPAREGHHPKRPRRETDHIPTSRPRVTRVVKHEAALLNTIPLPPGPPPWAPAPRPYSTLAPRLEAEVRAWSALRPWQPTALGRDLDSGALQLLAGQARVRLLSYNVLAQSLLAGHPYLYRESPAEALEWPYRWEGIRREVETFDPDIVCLQEVQMSGPDSFTTDYLPFFSGRGYRHVAKARTGDKKDGCVIFFKNSMFELDCVSQMEFKIDRVGILDRDNVGVVCRLAPRAAPDSPLVVATTHLLYNPRRDDIRLAQTALLLAEVDRLATPPVEAADRRYLPVLITGDFNSDPASPVLQLLANGRVHYQGLRVGGRRMPDKLLPDTLGLSDSCQWQVKLEQRGRGPEFQVGSGGFHHGLQLLSAYPPGPGVSTYQDEWTLVDYLFHSNCRRLQLAAKVRLPSASELRGHHLPGLPCPSDHLPLLADYLLSP